MTKLLVPVDKTMSQQFKRHLHSAVRVVLTESQSRALLFDADISSMVCGVINFTRLLACSRNFQTVLN